MGPPANPDGVVRSCDSSWRSLGPVREIQAGSGYWSQNGSVQVFGLSEPPTAVCIRWPAVRDARPVFAGGARRDR